jgi:moderate conductance mechanosensitive channel
MLTSIAMEIRNDPQFASAFLENPQVLGVDAITGSQVVYPVVFKTLATRQYGPIREFRRRVRLALEEQGMLPGDPNRTFREFAGKPADSAAEEAGPSPANSEEHARSGQKEPTVDPTTVRPVEHNPFTGE